MGAYDLKLIDIEITDHVAVATMTNPPVNALSRQMQDEMALAFDLMSDDDNVRVVVLTGQGKLFCAGADIKARTSGESAAGRSARSSAQRPRMLPCHRRVQEAGDRRDQWPGAGRRPRDRRVLRHPAGFRAGLARHAGDRRRADGRRPACDAAVRPFAVRRMAVTGYRVPGPELYRLGVVEACVPAAELMPAAMTFAKDIASKAPLAVQLFKQSLNAIEEMSLRDGYRYEQDMTVQIGKTEDSKEAMRAFVEKRKPVFQGR